MTLVLELVIELIDLLIIPIAPNPTGWSACLEEVQLIKLLSNVQTTYLSSAIMASNFRSCKNAQQVLGGSNQPEEALVEITPTPSTASTPSQVSILALILTLYN